MNTFLLKCMKEAIHSEEVGAYLKDLAEEIRPILAGNFLKLAPEEQAAIFDRDGIPQELRANAIEDLKKILSGDISKMSVLEA